MSEPYISQLVQIITSCGRYQLAVANVFQVWQIFMSCALVGNSLLSDLASWTRYLLAVVDISRLPAATKDI